MKNLAMNAFLGFFEKKGNPFLKKPHANLEKPVFAK
jgi:hypothetical protein